MILHIKTSFGPTAGEDVVKIMWPNVAKLSVNRPIPFSLKEGTTVVGTAQPGESGTMILKVASTGTPMAIPLDTVLGMNQPAVIYTGAIQAGFSQPRETAASKMNACWANCLTRFMF